MNTQRLATLAFAVVGVVLVASALPGLAQFGVMLFSREFQGFGVRMVVGLLVYLAIGLWLAFRGHLLSGRLFPDKEELVTGFRLDDALMAALLVLGVSMVMEGVGESVSRLVWHGLFFFEDYRIGPALSDITTIAVGLFLVVKARWIVRVWNRHTKRQVTEPDVA